MGDVSISKPSWDADPRPERQQGSHSNHSDVVSNRIITAHGHANHICSRLPKILNDVATLHLSCVKQLQTLPPPITNDPGAFVLNLITKFCTEIEAHVRGSPEFAKLVQANKEAYEKFKIRIRSTAPPFVPYVSPEDVRKDAVKQPRNKNILEMSSAPEGGIYLRDLREHIRA